MLRSLIILAIVAAPIVNSLAANESESNEPEKIDEGLYSRQLYLLGFEAMRRMANANVLIVGLGGLGVEIAKNVILSGVKSVTLHETENCTLSDLTAQYYLTEADIGKNRAEASHKQLYELNSYVRVHTHKDEITEEFLKQFQVVVLTETSNAEQDRIAAITHEHNIPLIIGQTRGLFAQIFCDFGVDFTVFDPTDEAPIAREVGSILKGPEGNVTCVERERHGFEDDHFVTFSEVEGMTELNGCDPIPVKVIDSFTFSIGDTSEFSEYTRGGIVTQVKMPKNITFKSLAESRKNPDYLNTDFLKFDRPEQYHVAFAALDEFVTQYGRLPAPWSDADAQAFLNLPTIRNAEVTIDEKLLTTFAKISAGETSPVNGIIGGTIAQEVLKACSGKFTPIQQFYYTDFLEVLPENDLTEDECKPIGSRYDRQIAIFGKKFQEKLGNLRYFIVGAGAIGCEHLKNFAMTGIAAGRKGEIIITDMDLIEKSNLNRQFLFRPHDVQQPKSETAAKVIKTMNKDIKITPHLNRVGPETENIYNERFYEKLDGVANALDNMEARRYMDERCLTNRRMLVDAGTEGAKGNVQPVIPFLSETYSDSNDIPQTGYASCTLKNFPHLIQHTLQWARDMFEGVFSAKTRNAQLFMQDPSFIDQIMKLPGDQPLTILESLKAALISERPQDFADCVEWARLQFEENYSNQIRQLLFKLPPDALASDNVTLFWSPPKRCPKPITFDVNDTMHIDYIYAAANLKAEMYGIKQVRDRAVIADLVSKVQVPEFVPRDDVTVAITDEDDNAEENNDKKNNKPSEEEIRSLIEELKKLSKLNLTVTPLDFEKDDDNNLHMDFIVACSNLRATNYGIEIADRHKSKLIAGKIIPAIATTTSVASGLAILEIFKYAQGHTDIDRYRSSYVHLAQPQLSQAYAPIETKKMKYGDLEFTQWDRFEISGEMTLNELLEYFKTEHKFEITGLMQGKTILYASWMAPAKLRDRMDMKLTKLVQVISKQRIPPTTRSLRFEITGETPEGVDIDNLPSVYYTLPRRHRTKRPSKETTAPKPEEQ